MMNKYIHMITFRIIQIRHSRNGQEHRVAGKRFRLDGVEIQPLPDGTDHCVRHAFEFMGCFFHGCPKHYSVDAFNPKMRKTMGQLHGEAMFKIGWLQTHGWKVRTIATGFSDA